MSTSRKSDRDMLMEVANMVGAPTLHYASDKQVRLELESRLQAVSVKIQEHFKLKPKPVGPGRHARESRH